MPTATLPIGSEDAARCYRAVRSRDRRFDGVFYTAVHTTGIYCRPSCPARTPARENVSFHRTAAAAQQAGFRACKRCLPDATPGSPHWDVAADAAGRAMRLIADGVVDREGVAGLAARLGYSPRHLSRLLQAELGAGPLALARARRAQTARVLVETTTLPLADVAFAAGFASVRAFNETLQQVYATTPTRLRGRGAPPGPPGTVTLRVAVRTPYDGRTLLCFLAARAVPGVEHVSGDHYTRTLSLPHGPGVLRLQVPHETQPGRVAYARLELGLTDLRDTTAAVERTRRLLDADADPVAVAAALADDPVLGPLVRARPGLRVPGHVDGHELAVRTVLGQQISVARARDLAGRIAAEHGTTLQLPGNRPPVTRLFPAPAVLASLAPEDLPMPRARGRAVIALSGALARRELSLDRGTDRDEERRRLLALPGLGPWTAGCVAMRALGDPDVFLDGDAGVRRALEHLGRPAGDAAEGVAASWAPWRSYAVMHLWTARSETSRPPAEDGRSGERHAESTETTGGTRCGR